VRRLPDRGRVTGWSPISRRMPCLSTIRPSTCAAGCWPPPRCRQRRAGPFGLHDRALAGGRRIARGRRGLGTTRPSRGRVDALGRSFKWRWTTASLERQLTDVQRTAVRAQLVAAVISALTWHVSIFSRPEDRTAGRGTRPERLARHPRVQRPNLPPLAAGCTYQVGDPTRTGRLLISAGFINPHGRQHPSPPPQAYAPAVVAVTDELVVDRRRPRPRFSWASPHEPPSLAE
jgi:hypothetical protein